MTACFVISRGDTSPVLEVVEQVLDEITPAIFFAVMRNRFPPIAFGGVTTSTAAFASPFSWRLIGGEECF
jgi:hypothetical protein